MNSMCDYTSNSFCGYYCPPEVITVIPPATLHGISLGILAGILPGRSFHPGIPSEILLVILPWISPKTYPEIATKILYRDSSRSFSNFLEKYKKELLEISLLIFFFFFEKSYQECLNESLEKFH